MAITFQVAFVDDRHSACIGFGNEHVRVAEGNAVRVRDLRHNGFDVVGGRIDDHDVIVRTLCNVGDVRGRVDDDLVAVAPDAGKGDGLRRGDGDLWSGRVRRLRTAQAQLRCAWRSWR